MNTNSRLAIILFVLLLLMSFTIRVSAQASCAAEIIMRSQAEVDAFSHVGDFNGSITIAAESPFGDTDITNLDALSTLTGVTATLDISRNPLLTDISGLANLTTIGGGGCFFPGLTMSQNESLTDLSPLQNMTGDLNIIYLIGMPGVTSLSDLSGINSANVLRVADMDGLTDLSGMENLLSLNFFEIYENDNLQSLNGLQNLAGELRQGNTSELRNNQSLSDISALSNLTFATILEIIGCPSLTDLTGLGGFTSINGELEINNNDGLTSLDGLNDNLVIGTRVRIEDNDLLSDCDARAICDQLTEGGQFGQYIVSGNANGCATDLQILAACSAECADGIIETITDQDDLDDFSLTYEDCRNFLGEVIIEEPANRSIASEVVDLSALSELKEIKSLRILNAPGLTDLSPLGGLEKVNEDLVISNTAVSSLNTLTDLDSIRLRLTIAENPSLTSVTSFTNIDFIGRGLVIQNNPLLSDLSGLGNLVTVGDALQVIGNPSLPDLSGFASLKFAFDGLRIENNDLLTSLAGLEQLENISGELRVSGNALLSDLSALENIDQTVIANAASPGIAITDNPVLSDCAVNTVCSFLARTDAIVTIFGNTGNCLDQPAAEDACLVLPVELQSFTARMNGKEVYLNWQTATEENTAEYRIARSRNGGRTFQEIGQLIARNNRTGAEYNFTDLTAAELPVARVYYQLIARDFDGSQQTFGPVQVAIPTDDSDELRVVPNPVFTDTQVSVRGAAAGAKLVLRAMDGRHLVNLTVKPEQTITLPGLAAGVYLLSGRNDGGNLLHTRIIVR